MGALRILVAIALISRSGLATLHHLFPLTVGEYHKLGRHRFLLWKRHGYGTLLQRFALERID